MPPEKAAFPYRSPKAISPAKRIYSAKPNLAKLLAPLAVKLFLRNS